MKVAVNATITDPRSTGLGVYTLHIVRELSKLVPSLTVYTSTPEDFPQTGVLLRRVANSVRPSYGLRGHLRRVFWSHVRLRKYLKNGDVSILLSPTPLESIINSPVPQVVVVHDLVPLFYPQYHPRQKFFFRHILPRILRSTCRIVADSTSTKEDLVHSYALPEEKIKVVHIAFDREVVSTSKSISRSRERPFLLYVGNLFPHKNLHRLLEAFSIASRRIPHELRIAGNQDARFYPSLLEATKRLNIIDRVKFLDYVPREQLTSLYSTADVFVFPSLYEGFGIPPLEAMASSLPVIASSTKALREVLGDAAEFVDPTDIPAMADGLIAVASSEEKKEELRSKGLKRVELYSWKRSAEELHAILVEAATAASNN